jgi:hypothetical protein
MTVIGDQRNRVGGWTVTVAATGSRVTFGLLFTSFVSVALPSSQAIRVYQLLFLQGGLIALLAGAAYARGAHIAARGAAPDATTWRFARYLLVMGIAAFLVAAGLLPLHDTGTPVRLGVLVLMVVGAMGSALNGWLQGLTAVTTGVSAAFLPTLLVSSVACLLTIGVWGSRPLLLVAALWAIPQILTPCVLLATRPELRRNFRGRRSTGHSDTDYFAATGAVNVASVAVAYAFRERWSAAQAPPDAATGFLVVRFTEIGYQVLYMLLASTPLSVVRVVERVSAAARGLGLVLLALPFTLLGAVSVVAENWSMTRFLVAEALVAPGRILSVFCLLYLLGRPSTRPYQVAVGVSTLSSASLMLVPWLQESPYGLQVFHAAGLLPMAVVAAVVARRRSTDLRRSNSVEPDVVHRG